MREYGYLFLLIASNEKRGRRLLLGCQDALKTHDRALVAHRYATRTTTDAYEVTLSDAEFDARNEFGCFVLDWQHKDVRYALGVEVDRWLDGGLNVVCLAAPGCIEAARRRYHTHVRVVYAPSAKTSSTWLDRLLSEKQVRFGQLGLGFDGQPDTTDGLRLNTDSDLAVQQLCGWMQMPTPPVMAAA